mgnify:CR=1 FL=1
MRCFILEDNKGINSIKKDDSILSVRDVVKAYKLGSGDTLTVLDHINYELPRGQLIMLMGRSGSGKTTLMNLLSTLDDVTAGDIIFHSRDRLNENEDGSSGKVEASDTASDLGSYRDYNYSEMKQEDKELLRRFKIGFVFQSIALIPVMTAYENVDFGLRTAEYKGDRDRRVKEVLESVGLADRAKHFPGELSGGERQRIAIARAMAHRPEILFADEPTGALDTASGIYIAELFKSMTRNEGITVVMTTHDIRLSELADMLIQL